MAEVVSLIVAAPALVDLAKYCGKLAIELYNYSEERKKAKFEIANYANQIKCSSTTIRTSHATLARYHQRFPQSIVLQDLATEGTIKATEDMSESIIARLKTVTKDLIDQNDTPISALRYIMWRFGKKDVLEVILQLGRVQQNIQLIVNMLGIEACELEIKGIVRMMRRRVNNEADLKIKALEKQIREQQIVIQDQLKTISRMEKQAKRYKEDRQVSGRLQVLHRMGSLIVVGGMDSLQIERVSRRRQSRSSLSSSNSSASSSSNSSASSSSNSFVVPFEAPLHPVPPVPPIPAVPPVPPIPAVPTVPPIPPVRPVRQRTTRQRMREM